MNFCYLNEYVRFLSKPLALAVLSTVIFVFVINPVNAIFKVAEVAISIYVQMVFLAWIFFSAFLLVRADEEWKKTDEAVRKKNFEQFKIEAPKKIPVSAVMVYLVIVFLAATSFYLFHFEYALLGAIILFGITFIVCLTTFVIFDLDDPTKGLINVENIPKDWIEKVKRQ